MLYRTECGWDNDRALYVMYIQPYSQLHRIPIQRPIHIFCRPGCRGNIPNVAPFANEPTYPSQVANCTLQLDVSSLANVDGQRKYATHRLVTATAVAPGQELTWDYGADYKPRDYPSKYDAMVIRQALHARHALPSRG